MSRASFILTYDGPALDTHEMAARDLAPALIAVSDVLEQANQTLNGERTKVAVHVRASFRTGSFGIDFSVVQSLGRQQRPVDAAGIVEEVARPSNPRSDHFKRWSIPYRGGRRPLRNRT